jgi:hypothetical protein
MDIKFTIDEAKMNIDYEDGLLILEVWNDYRNGWNVIQFWKDDIEKLKAWFASIDCGE